jgi:hypothetical protein
MALDGFASAVAKFALLPYHDGVGVAEINDTTGDGLWAQKRYVNLPILGLKYLAISWRSLRESNPAFQNENLTS